MQYAEMLSKYSRTLFGNTIPTSNMSTKKQYDNMAEKLHTFHITLAVIHFKNASKSELSSREPNL